MENNKKKWNLGNWKQKVWFPESYLFPNYFSQFSSDFTEKVYVGVSEVVFGYIGYLLQE